MRNITVRPGSCTQISQTWKPGKTTTQSQWEFSNHIWMVPISEWHLVVVAGSARRASPSALPHSNCSVHNILQGPAQCMEQTPVLMLVRPSAVKPDQLSTVARSGLELLSTHRVLLLLLLVVFAAAHRQKLRADPLQSPANGCLIDDLCEREEGVGDAWGRWGGSER